MNFFGVLYLERKGWMIYPVIDSGIRPRKVDCHLDAGIRASHWHVVIRSHYWTPISESRLSSKFISAWVSAPKNTRFPIVFWLLFLFFISNDIFWFQSISYYCFVVVTHTHQAINSLLVFFFFLNWNDIFWFWIFSGECCFEITLYITELTTWCVFTCIN